MTPWRSTVDILRQEADKKFPSPPPAVSSQQGGHDHVMTTLGEDTDFKGTLKFKHTLKIEGKFEGDITTDGNLIVGRTGEVRAEIRAGSLVVEGKVHGNITAEDLIELRSTAEMHGDITAAKLKIDEGVIFVGKTDVQPKERRMSGPGGPKPPQKKDGNNG